MVFNKRELGKRKIRWYTKPMKVLNLSSFEKQKEHSLKLSGAVVNLLQERRRRDSAVCDAQTLHTSIDSDETPHPYFRAVEDRSYQFH